MLGWLSFDFFSLLGRVRFIPLTLSVGTIHDIANAFLRAFGVWVFGLLILGLLPRTIFLWIVKLLG